MRKKFIVRITASLVLTAVLLLLPIAGLMANDRAVLPAFAEDDGAVSSDDEEGGENATDQSENADDSGSGKSESPDTSGDGKTQGADDSGTGKTDSDTGDTDSGTEKTEDSAKDKDPVVMITFHIPTTWHAVGNTQRVSFSVDDIAFTGKLKVKEVRAKIGQNGSYQDVTDDMFLEISENCIIYVQVTDVSGKTYEKNKYIKCFDSTKPTLNAAVSEGLLSIQCADYDSGIKRVYVNGYEFKDITDGTVNIRLSQFEAGYEYFSITAMDNAGNLSEVYKTRNPYYKDPKSEDDDNPAAELPVSASATPPTSATAQVTEHTGGNQTSSAGSGSTQVTTSQTDTSSQESQKKAELKKAADEEAALYGKSTEPAGKEFYTIQAASGKVFYLIIDRDAESETVYFLTEISENDLLNVTTDNSQTLPKNSAALESQIPVEESALPNNNADEMKESTASKASTEEENADAGDTGATTESEEDMKTETKTNPLLSYLVFGVIAAAAIGAGYYFKVMRKKQEGDFVEDEDEEDDDDEFDEDEETEDDSFMDGEDASADSDEVPAVNDDSSPEEDAAETIDEEDDD